MALTPSKMVPLGSQLPEFVLTDVVSGQTMSNQSFANKKALLVMFICNHCPFVKHINNELVALADDYASSELAIVAISANDPANYPEDAPDKMKIAADNLGYKFPYLFDETQEVAKSFEAACTPDFFLYDESRRLVYRGQLDDSRPGNEIPVSGKDLRKAIDSLLAGEEISEQQVPAVGCNIKWKA